MLNLSRVLPHGYDSLPGLACSELEPHKGEMENMQGLLGRRVQTRRELRPQAGWGKAFFPSKESQGPFRPLGACQPRAVARRGPLVSSPHIA